MVDGASRWDAERAVKVSALPAQSRLIIYTLLTHVTNGTLVVPAKYAPTFSALVEQTGLARGTLSKYLNLLEGDGWLKRNRPSKQRAMQGHQRTGYEITPPVHLLNQFRSRTGSGDEPADEEPQVTASSGAEPVRETNQNGSGAEHIPTYLTSSSPTEKKRGGAGGQQRRSKTADEPADFAAWYETYPVHKARGAAAKAFAKAIVKTDLQTLTAAAKRYRDDPQVTRGYGKHPATWLNAECWLDESAPANGFAATGTDGAPRHGARARVNDTDWSQGGPTL